MGIKTNPVAIVTGASQGIGKGIAGYLASKGYKLLLLARSYENLKKTAEEIAANNYDSSLVPTIAAVDISDYETVKTIITRYIKTEGQIDLLCNNAGYVKSGSSNLSHDEFTKMLNTNLIGAFNGIQMVAPFMKKQMSGRIINISSHSGKVARKQLGGYAASKFGLMGLNEGIYKELAEYGVYVTAICPNLVATEMTTDVQMNTCDMMQIDDVIKTLDYLLSLSPSVAIKEIVMQCRTKLIQE